MGYTVIREQNSEIQRPEFRKVIDYMLQAGGLMAKGRKWEESEFRAE